MGRFILNYDGHHFSNTCQSGDRQQRGLSPRDSAGANNTGYPRDRTRSNSGNRHAGNINNSRGRDRFVSPKSVSQLVSATQLEQSILTKKDQNCAQSKLQIN